MTPQTFEIKIENFKQWMQTQFTRDVIVRGALDMAKDINRRVENTGEGATGSFGSYSTKTTLVGPGSFIPEKQGEWEKLMARAKSKKKKLKDIHWVSVAVLSRGFALRTHLIVLPGGYAEIRRLEGQTNSYKNFSRTREMWLNFGVKSESSQAVILGGKNNPSQDKINWNSAREKKNIIQPTENEIQKLADNVAKMIAKKMNETL